MDVLNTAAFSVAEQTNRYKIKLFAVDRVCVLSFVLLDYFFLDNYFSKEVCLFNLE